MPNPLTAVLPAQNTAKSTSQPAEGSGRKADTSFQSVLDDQPPSARALPDSTEELIAQPNADAETEAEVDTAETPDRDIESALPVAKAQPEINPAAPVRPDFPAAASPAQPKSANGIEIVQPDQRPIVPPKRNPGARRAEVSPVFKDEASKIAPTPSTRPAGQALSVASHAKSTPPVDFPAQTDIRALPHRPETDVDATARPKPPAAPAQAPSLVQMQLLVSESSSTQFETAPMPEADEGLILKETSATGASRETLAANLPTTARPEVARAIAGQMAAAITVRPQSGAVEITLNPEELGRVSMVLSGRDDGLHLTIAAERPETLDLMRRHLAVLEAEFKSLGFGDLSFDLGNSADKGQDPSDSGENSFSETAQSELTSATLQRPANLGTSGRIDIRL